MTSNLKSMILFPVICEMCFADHSYSFGIGVALNPDTERGGALLSFSYDPTTGLTFDMFWVGLWG